ncbi:MAG: D-alanyl-D-alanine carboxypeptidase, partial [Acidobacteriota bacterium]
MKKSLKRIELVGIISLLLIFTAFNFGIFVSAQDTNRDKVIVVQTQSNYVVEVKSKMDAAKIEISSDGNRSSNYTISANRPLLLYINKKIKLKFDKKLRDNFQVLINGKTADLQNKNEIEFDENKLRQFPKPVPTPTPIITPTLTPVVTPTPIPTPPPIQTLPELQSRIRLSLSRPELRRGSVGIKIVSLSTGKVIFEENAEKYFMPASNMKSYTVGTAMEKLTPNFRINTSVYSGSMPDSNGVIKGDLT